MSQNVITAAQARATGQSAASILAVARWNDAHAKRDPNGRRVPAHVTARRQRQADALRAVAAQLAASNDNATTRAAA
jgi:hypothetical protein